MGMPHTNTAARMECLNSLSQSIQNIKQETAIAREALHILAPLLPARASAILCTPDPKHESLVLHAAGAWQEYIGKTVRISQRFIHSDSKPKRIPAEDVPLESAALEGGVFLNIPLKAQNQSWGHAFLSLAKDVDADELEFLSLAFAWVASAIANANLSQRVEQFRLQMDLLTSVERALNNSLTLSVTKNMLLDSCLRLLEADAAALWVMDAQERTLTLAAERGFRGVYAFPHGQPMGEEHLVRQACAHHKLTILSAEEAGEGDTARMMRRERFQYGFAMPLLARGECKGALEVFRRSAWEPSEEWMRMLETVANQAAVAVDHSLMSIALERLSIQMSVTCDAAIEAFARAVDMRAREAEGHGLRVADLTVRMAEKANMPLHHVVHVRRGALLHDIGKIAVPDAVLWKAGSLDDRDWEVMRRHPQYAADILESLHVLQPAMAIPQYHHERWDGGGYPYGLAGGQIPLAARLFAVVDTWDSMLSRRPHREPLAKSVAEAHIRKGAGSQFDPEAVLIFLGLMDEFEDSPRPAQ
jgi:GAF domain-containing protein